MYCADWYGRPVLGYQQFMSSLRAFECKPETVLVFHQTNPYLLKQVIQLPMAPPSMSYSHLALNTIFADTPRHNIIFSIRSVKTLNVLLTAHSPSIKGQTRRQNPQAIVCRFCLFHCASPLLNKNKMSVSYQIIFSIGSLFVSAPQVTSTCSLLHL